ncbi:MAG: amidase family protein, partial [Nisaea sp.]
MSRDLAMMSATDLVQAYAAGTISPVEVVKASLVEIRKHNETFNAFVHIDEGTTLAAAKASEERWKSGTPIGIVDGVPTTIKDLAEVKGWPVRRGSRTSDPNFRSIADSPFVARLRDHGAVFMGKTTTPEYGWKGVTDSP